MPCDSIQYNSLEIGKMDPKLLAAALKALGATGITTTAGGRAQFFLDGQWVRISGGRMTVQEGAEHLADKVKQGYSRQAVLYSAKRNGWTIKEVAPNKFAIAK